MQSSIIKTEQTRCVNAGRGSNIGDRSNLGSSPRRTTILSQFLWIKTNTGLKESNNAESRNLKYTYIHCYPNRQIQNDNFRDLRNLNNKMLSK